MSEDSTRKLLKVFGVSVTDCEDALSALTAALRDPSGPSPVAALEAYGKAAREISQRWAEVSRLILDYHARAQEAIEAYIRARGGP
ncbi:MAG: hypothetical protein HY002_00970 [Candidatus Rokubacteria bacterium]|nr:hypothetical protein [Candidatus Rokubacteria bacterium]